MFEKIISRKQHSLKLEISFVIAMHCCFFSIVNGQVGDSVQTVLQKESGAFMVISAYITISARDWQTYLLDSIRWQQLPSQKKFYAGKKIKRILYQKSTDRLCVFASGNYFLQMNKITAIHEGLIKADKEISWMGKRTSNLPGPQIEMYLDSPLYINKLNQLHIETAEENDIMLGSEGATITRSENENDFSISVSLPGHGEIYFNDSVTQRTKYVYHFIAKRLPADGPDIIPEAFLGNIKTMNATAEQIRSQSEIKVNGGLFFESAVVYFSGNGFKDVIIARIKKELGYLKCYLDLCLPGSIVIFDNLRVHDKNNKVYAANNIIIHVMDSSYLIDPSTDYVSMNIYPDFFGSNNNVEHYIKAELKLAAADSIMPSSQNVFLMLRIGTEGQVLPPCENEQTMSPLEKICFNIIKNGPKWAAGTFKGQPVPMIVPISFNVNLNDFKK